MMSQSHYRWAELAGPEVAALARETEVAILPVGCVEMHGPHLPTGTDAFTASAVADLVVEQEPAVILPTLYYNLNDEMVCYPGTIAISPELVAALYEEICCECARNGFRRIVLLLGHGGSQDVTNFLHHSLLHRRAEQSRDYRVFSVLYPSFAEPPGVLETPRCARGHGCEAETSYMWHVRPDLVHTERLEPLPEGEGPHHPKSVPGAVYVVDWARQVPKGYVGKPHLATAAKGQALVQAIVDECVRIVRDVRRYDFDRDP